MTTLDTACHPRPRKNPNPTNQDIKYIWKELRRLRKKVKKLKRDLKK